MIVKRDSLGYINLEDLDIAELKKEGRCYSFTYDGQKYYYKKCRNIFKCYNELIADEIANQYGIDHAHYDLASLDGQIGFISDDCKKNDGDYWTMHDFLKKVYGVADTDDLNNLNDIIRAFEVSASDPQKARVLSDKLIDLFLFDVLIANVDRHNLNYGLAISDDDIHLTPIFDNSEMLDYDTIGEGYYSLAVSRENKYGTNNMLQEFLTNYDYRYHDLLEEKIKIISSDNIENILQRVEYKIGVPMQPVIRKKLVTLFKENHDMISKSLNMTKGKTKKINKHKKINK